MKTPEDPRFLVEIVDQDGYKLISFRVKDSDQVILMGPKSAFDLGVAILRRVQAIAHVKGLERDAAEEAAAPKSATLN